MKRDDDHIDPSDTGGEAACFEKDMKSGNATFDLTEFEALLATYGANTARWPIERRAVAGALLAADPQARALLAEARALDDLLDLAPPPGADRQAKVAARIVAQALSERPASTEPKPIVDNVVPLRRLTATKSATPAMHPPVPRRQGWQVGGVLAASLVLGLLIGSFGLTAGMLDLDDDDTVAALYGVGVFTGIDEDRI